MPPSPDGKIIDDAVQDFVRGLHSDLPLRHFAEFHDQEELKKVVEQQKERVLGNVIAKVWTRDKEEIFSLLMKVINRINKEVIAEWRTRNGEHRVKSLSFLQKWVDMICEDFTMALDYQLLINPDMEIESLTNYVQRRKQVATSCFENIWKPGTAQLQEERRSKLEKQLQFFEQEIFEKRQRILESKSVDEGNKLLGEIRTILLERSRQLKCYVDKHQGQVARDTLKRMLEELRDYILNGKGRALRESHEENFNKLVEVTEEEIKFWSEEPKGEMTAEDVIGYAERFDEKIHSCCCDNPSDNVQEMQQDISTRDPDPTEDPRRRTTMLGVLNEFRKEHGYSLDLERHDAESLNDESNVNGGNDGNNNGGMEPELSTGEKRRQHPSCRLFKKSVTEADFHDPTIISGTTSAELPSSKKQRTGREAPRKITTRADIEIRRRSSRLHKAVSCNSISAQKAFPACRYNPRKKKSLHDLDLAEKCRSDGDEFPHLNNIDDDNIQRGNISSADVFEAPSSFTTSPPNLRRKKQENEHNLYRTRQMQLRSKHVVSRTTWKARNAKSSLRASSEHAELCSVSNKPKRSKLGRARNTCHDDDEVCPKQNHTAISKDCPKYFCNVCKRKFNTKKYYVRYHGEFCGKRRPFICGECGKGFHYQGELFIHKRVHTGEKPFRCAKCPERFTQKGRLQAHIRSHANKNPYVCKLCNLTFVSVRSLHEHYLTHEGKFQLTCSYCDKRYDSMNMLRKHVIIHTDERPFQCPKCGTSFSRMDNLRPHIEQIHCQTKHMANKLAYDACVAYLLEETKNESYRDIPAHKVDSTVVSHVIKKANLRLPSDISTGDRAA